VPVPAKQIQSTKVLATCESIQRLIYSWEKVGVLDDNDVESAVVHAESPATILVIDQSLTHRRQAQSDPGREDLALVGSPPSLGLVVGLAA